MSDSETIQLLSEIRDYLTAGNPVWDTDMVEETMDVAISDVMSVRHGRWKEYGVNNDNTHNIACSICGHEIKSRGHANSVYTELKYRYCPYCGAKMDGGNDE